jgi:hypothetical protein
MHPLRALTFALLLAGGLARAGDAPSGELVASASTGAAAEHHSAAPTESAKAKGSGEKTLSGMSILGNQEAPKSLVIVPWKSSRIGDGVGLDDHLDDSRTPVDREVFMRELAYYEIRSK